MIEQEHLLCVSAQNGGGGWVDAKVADFFQNVGSGKSRSSFLLTSGMTGSKVRQR